MEEQYLISVTELSDTDLRLLTLRSKKQQIVRVCGHHYQAYVKKVFIAPSFEVVL